MNNDDRAQLQMTHALLRIAHFGEQLEIHPIFPAPLRRRNKGMGEIEEESTSEKN